MLTTVTRTIVANMADGFVTILPASSDVGGFTHRAERVTKASNGKFCLPPTASPPPLSGTALISV
jgi:hypothetical protein